MIIAIMHNGVQYALDAPPEVCRRIQTDKCFASRYVDSILKMNGQDKPSKRDVNGNVKELSVPSHPIEPSTSTQSSTPPLSTSIASTSHRTESYSSAEPQSADESPVTDLAFDHKAVLLFLDECIKLKDDLRSCKIRRKHVFDKIAANMQLHGYSFSSATLDKKLANLRTTYNKVKDNNNAKKRTGRGRMCWPYMEQMCSIYEYELDIADAPVISSMLTTPASSRQPYRPIRSSAALDEDGDPDDISPRYRRNNSSTAREELMAIERKKVEIGKAMLEELRRMSEAKERHDNWDKEMRSRQLDMDRERLDFEKKKYEESKSTSK